MSWWRNGKTDVRIDPPLRHHNKGRMHSQGGQLLAYTPTCASLAATAASLSRNRLSRSSKSDAPPTGAAAELPEPKPKP